MPIGRPSIRVQRDHPTHHLWNNKGTWWIHFTVHFDHRKRRIRRSRGTRSLDEAMARRDSCRAGRCLDLHATPWLSCMNVWSTR